MASAHNPVLRPGPRGQAWLGFSCKREPLRLAAVNSFLSGARGRRETQTAALLRALVRELVRTRLEAGRNAIESKLIAGDEAERAILELLTEDDKRQLGLLPSVAETATNGSSARATNGSNGGAHPAASRKRRGRSTAVHL